MSRGQRSVTLCAWIRISSMLDEETIAYLTQCTVCFVSEADIELANCGDQLCLTCLEQYTLHLTFRYVKWIVKMSLFNIKPVNVYCPICQVLIDQDDWRPVAYTPISFLLVCRRRCRGSI